MGCHFLLQGILAAQGLKRCLFHLLMKVKEKSEKAVLKLSILEKEMATHSSILARIIAWTEEPGGHDLATKSKK